MRNIIIGALELATFIGVCYGAHLAIQKHQKYLAEKRDTEDPFRAGGWRGRS